MENVVDQVAPGGTSPEIAGRAIQQGITGPGGFRGSFNAKAGQLLRCVSISTLLQILPRVSRTR